MPQQLTNDDDRNPSAGGAAGSKSKSDDRDRDRDRGSTALTGQSQADNGTLTGQSTSGPSGQGSDGSQHSELQVRVLNGVSGEEQ